MGDEIGDFRVVDAALEAAEDIHDERPAESQRADERRRAPVTTDFNRWKKRPDELDFPGVDTPTSEPVVLPKDLMQPRKPERTAVSRGEAPPDPTPAKFSDAPESELARLASTDVSLSPEEAFEGVGATSRRAIGGFDPNREREVDPVTKKTSPLKDTVPEIEDERRIGELDEQTRTIGSESQTIESDPSPAADIAFVFEESDTQTELDEFRRRVNRKQREFGGLADEFGAAVSVADDLGRDD